MSGAPARHPRTGRALAFWGLVLLAACTLAVTAASMLQLRAVARSEAQARAQIVADAVASHVQRAVTVGVPLRKLEGVEALFAQRMQTRRDIEALALVDLEHRPLWVRAQGGAAELPPGPRAVAAVSAGGTPVASVVLVWREPGAASLLSRWLLPVAALVAAIAVLAAEVLRYRLARGVQLRDARVGAACQRIRAGDFSWRFPSMRRHEFDPRTTWLSGEVRHVNELHLRVRRLVHSLRQTEPEAVRRAELDASLQRASGDEHFRGDDPAVVIGAHDGAHAASRFAGIVLALVAWAWCATAILLVHARLLGAGPAAACVVAGLLLLAVPARHELRRRATRAAATGFGIGSLVIGPGILLPAWLALGPGHLAALGVVADAVLLALIAASAGVMWVGWGGSPAHRGLDDAA